jgi:hypothetical protein
MRSSFGDGWALAGTLAHCNKLASKLQYAQMDVRSILKEMQNQTGYAELTRQANQLIDAISRLEKAIERNKIRAKTATALELVSKVQSDSMVLRIFKVNTPVVKHRKPPPPQEPEIFPHITTRFGTSWPLVAAKEHLVKLASDLAAAQELILQVNQESKGRSEYVDFMDKLSVLPKIILDLTKNIEERVAVITNRRDYASQISLYESYKQDERRQQHEERLLAEKLGHERSLEAAKLEHEARQKEKDRLAKLDEEKHK